MFEIIPLVNLKAGGSHCTARNCDPIFDRIDRA
jgi:hypothetical protein